MYIYTQNGAHGDLVIASQLQAPYIFEDEIQNLDGNQYFVP